MRISRHIILGIIVTIISGLIIKKPLVALTFFTASILIDLDHYLYFIIKDGNLNPFHAYKKCTTPYFEIRTMLFHSQEFLTFIGILLVLTNTTLPINIYVHAILLGMTFHTLCDWIGSEDEYFRHYPSYFFSKEKYNHQIVRTKK